MSSIFSNLDVPELINTSLSSKRFNELSKPHLNKRRNTHCMYCWNKKGEYRDITYPESINHVATCNECDNYTPFINTWKINLNSPWFLNLNNICNKGLQKLFLKEFPTIDKPGEVVLSILDFEPCVPRNFSGPPKRFAHLTFKSYKDYAVQESLCCFNIITGKMATHSKYQGIISKELLAVLRRR
jgi:hypothetical protein